MAIRGAVATGNWSNPLTWDGLVSLPASGDTVVANGFTVTIDSNQNIGSGTIQTLETGVFSRGGGFTLSSGVTLTANVLAGYTTCVTHSSGNGTIIGSVTGGYSSAARGVSFTSTGTLSITGNITGGSLGSSNQGVYNNSASGTINITGSVTGGSGAAGVTNFTTGTVNITGAVSAASLQGVVITAGTVTITGNCSADAVAACNLQTNGTLTINGNVSHIGSLSGPAITTTTGGTLLINGNVSAGTGGIGSTGLTIGANIICTVNGNVSGSSAAAGVNCSGTITINGDITAGVGNHGLSLTAAGVLATSNTTSGTITPSVTPGVYGINSSGSGSISYKGNVVGSAESGGGNGIHMTSSAACTITGNVTTNANSHGIANTSVGTITVNGNVTAGSFGPGIKRTSTFDQKTIINGGIVGETSVGWPGIITGVLGKVVIGASAAQSHTYATDNGGSIGTLRTLSTGNTVFSGRHRRVR